jgi:predicted SnoaL-like aldol condensation-catalyzing enzyme
MTFRSWLSAAVLCVFASSLEAQVPPVAVADQLALLKSGDAGVQRNKRIVFDFWRIVYEGGHAEFAPKYMAESYIQHNPNMASGRETWLRFFKKVRPPRPIADHIKAPVISIIADRDMVMVLTARKVRDRAHPDHGLIAEHWDPSEMWVDGKPPGAEFFSEWDH